MDPIQDIANNFVVYRPKEKVENKQEYVEFIMFKELMKQRLIDYPLEFFEYLKRMKHELAATSCIGDINMDSVDRIKDIGYYSIVSFRIFICELFHRAIHCFPLVSEYKIICTNNVTNSIIHFKQFDELDDQNEPCLVKVHTSFDSFIMNKRNILEVFTANRKINPDYSVINSIVLSMNMGGNDSKVKTTYIINKNMVKHIKK